MTTETLQRPQAEHEAEKQHALAMQMTEVKELLSDGDLLSSHEIADAYNDLEQMVGASHSELLSDIARAKEDIVDADEHEARGEFEEVLGRHGHTPERGVKSASIRVKGAVRAIAGINPNSHGHDDHIRTELDGVMSIADRVVEDRVAVASKKARESVNTGWQAVAAETKLAQRETEDTEQSTVSPEDAVDAELALVLNNLSKDIVGPRHGAGNKGKMAGKMMERVFGNKTVAALNHATHRVDELVDELQEQGFVTETAQQLLDSEGYQTEKGAKYGVLEHESKKLQAELGSSYFTFMTAMRVVHSDAYAKLTSQMHANHRPVREVLPDPAASEVRVFLDRYDELFASANDGSDVGEARNKALTQLSEEASAGAFKDVTRSHELMSYFFPPEKSKQVA